MSEVSNQLTNSHNENSTQIPEVRKSNGGKFYKVGFFALFSVFLVILGAIGSWYYFSQKATSLPSEPSPTTTMTETTLEAPSPTAIITQEEKEVVIGLSPTVTEKSDIQEIKETMAKRHGKRAEETIINISKNTGTHATGGVKFEGEIGGGWFLAAKKDGKWVIVDDGNGTISCEIIEPWDFPSSIVPECVDELGNPVTR